MSKKWKKTRSNEANRIQAANEPSSFRICGASEPLELQALDTAAAADGKPKLRKFNMIAYTGGAINVGFGYPVVVDLAGMQVPSQNRPILRDHETTQIVGHTDKIEVQARQIKVSGVISGVGEAAQEVLALAGNGFPWQSSIGASIQKREFVDAGAYAVVNGKRFDGPILVARQTILGEVSFVPIGADSATSATVTAKSTDGATTMTDFEKWLQAQGIDAATLTAAAKAELQAAFDAKNKPPVIPPTVTPSPGVDPEIQASRQRRADEARRVAAIDQIQAKYGNPTMTIGTGDDAQLVHICAHAIAEGWDEVRTERDCLRASRPTTGAAVQKGKEDCTLQALQGAMLLRFGGRLDHPSYQTVDAVKRLSPWLRANLNDAARNKVMEAAHQYSDLSAVDICREALRLAGKPIPHSREELIQAAFSGGTLTNIFTDSINARLLAGMTTAPDTTGGWTQETEVADFKTNTDISLVNGGPMKRRPRGMKAQHGSRTDEAETYNVASYSEQFTVTEEDVIDDALHAIDQMPGQVVDKCADLRPDLVYSILLANPTLAATTRELFNATDDNMDTSSALSSQTLKIGIANMLVKQQAGRNLNLRPTHLIVPSTLSFLAKEITQSPGLLIGWGADDETLKERGNLNVIANENLSVIDDARLENGTTDPATETAYSGSASTWYMACARAKTILVAYMRGRGKIPRVRTGTLDKGEFGIWWDVDFVIGAKARDFRGLYRAAQ